MLNKFRPFFQVSGGVLYARSQYTEAKGTLGNGLLRSDVIFKDFVPMAGLSSGFDYRIDKYLKLGFSINYNISGKYSEPIDGYERYNGFLISLKLGVVF